MSKDPKATADMKEAKRGAMPIEMRNTVALEEIADKIDDLRVQLLLINSTLMRIASKP